MLEKFATAYGWMARARTGVTVSLLAGLLVLEALCGAALVHADTVNRYPTGDFAANFTTLVGAASHFDAVDDAVADGSATYVEANADLEIDLFSFPAFSVPAGATNIAVSVTYVAQKGGALASSLAPYIRVSGADYTGTAVDPVNGTFTQYSHTWAQNPNTSSAWSIAEVNGTALQYFGLVALDTTQPPQVTQAYITVTYTPSGNRPIMHNSATTGSLKWSGNGGWGVAGGRYGEFKCTTCHQGGTTNIKRIRTTLPTTLDPIAPTTTNFPGTTITFLDAMAENTLPGAGTADFGDDGR
ncbi:MAG: hypothetical protein C0614_12235, partial [Desulfuromonas sp.]